MELNRFVSGMIIGLLTCAPIGPIGLFCVRRTLTYGRTIGVASLLGASTADMLYCTAACFGIKVITNFVEREQLWLNLAGGLVLVFLGIWIFRLQPKEKGPKRERQGVFGAYSSTFLLMLTNPAPILVFSATFTALGIQGWTGDYLSTALVITGVFFGSAAWSPILIVLGTVLRLKYNPEKASLVNKVSGIVIALLGVGLLLMHLLGWPV
jgi:threonine/homoserine/homoserine lactone efflux protein